MHSERESCVAMVNGEWGSGKTVFLGFCAQWLRFEAHPSPLVLRFNAWQQGYSKNPLVDLTHFITTGLSPKPGKKQRGLANKAAKNLALSVSDQIASRTLGIINLAAFCRRVPNQTQQVERQLAELREQLAQVAEERRLVVLIDELDRCEPAYALRLIEDAYLVFKVPGVFVVLAANRNALEQSIKVTHGARYDAEWYLRRFIDEQITLPEPGAKYIADLLMSRFQPTSWFDDSDMPRCWDACRVLALLPLSDVRSIRDLEIAQRLLQRLVANTDEAPSYDRYSGGLTRTDLTNYAAMLIALRMLSEEAFDALERNPTAGGAACKRLLDKLNDRFNDAYTDEETMYYLGRLVGLLLSIGGTSETGSGPAVKSSRVDAVFNDAGMSDIESTVHDQRRRHAGAESNGDDRSVQQAIRLPIAQWCQIIKQELPPTPSITGDN